MELIGGMCWPTVGCAKLNDSFHVVELAFLRCLWVDGWVDGWMSQCPPKFHSQLLVKLAILQEFKLC